MNVWNSRLKGSFWFISCFSWKKILSEKSPRFFFFNFAPPDEIMLLRLWFYLDLARNTYLMVLFYWEKQSILSFANLIISYFLILFGRFLGLFITEIAYFLILSPTFSFTNNGAIWIEANLLKEDWNFSGWNNSALRQI